LVKLFRINDPCKNITTGLGYEAWLAKCRQLREFPTGIPGGVSKFRRLELKLLLYTSPRAAKDVLAIVSRHGLPARPLREAEVLEFCNATIAGRNG
jgi:hypothetical protein